jgi:WD40 repeat protein
MIQRRSKLAYASSQGLLVTLVLTASVGGSRWGSTPNAAATSPPVSTLSPSHTIQLPSIVYCGLLTSDEKEVILSSQDGLIRWWNLKTNKPTRVLDVGEVRMFALLPSGKEMISGTNRDSTVWVRDSRTGKELRGLYGHVGRIYALAVSSDGRLLASGGSDQVIYLWNVESGRLLSRWSTPFGSVVSLAFAPDSETIASGGLGNTIIVRDTYTGQILHTLRHDNSVASVAFSPDGFLLAAIGPERATVWDVITGDKMWESLELVGRALTFSPDGSLLVTGSTEITLYDLQKKRPLGEIAGHQAGILSLSYSRNGRWLVSTSRDRTCRIWDVSDYHREKNIGQHYSHGDLQRYWDAIASRNPSLAYDAIWKLSHSSRHTIPLFRTKLKPITREMSNAEDIARLLRDLDHDTFRVRESASAELEKQAEAAEGMLREVRNKTSSFEVRSRLDRLLTPLDLLHQSPSHVRMRRAIRLLELFNTPASIELLESLGKVESRDWLSELAKDAIRRLKNKL